MAAGVDASGEVPGVGAGVSADVPGVSGGGSASLPAVGGQTTAPKVEGARLCCVFRVLCLVCCGASWCYNIVRVEQF